MGRRNPQVMPDFSGQLVDLDFTSCGTDEEARSGDDHKRFPQCRAWLRGEEVRFGHGSPAPTASKPLVFAMLASHGGSDVRFRLGGVHLGLDVAGPCCARRRSDGGTYTHGPRAVRYCRPAECWMGNAFFLEALSNAERDCSAGFRTSRVERLQDRIGQSRVWGNHFADRHSVQYQFRALGWQQMVARSSNCRGRVCPGSRFAQFAIVCVAAAADCPRPGRDRFAARRGVRTDDLG